MALATNRTVPELLASTTSMELEKWKAYERHEGPIGINKYDTEMLLQIQEYLQLLVRFTAMGHGIGKASDFEFHRLERPWFEPSAELPEEAKKEREQADVQQFAAHFKT